LTLEHEDQRGPGDHEGGDGDARDDRPGAARRLAGRLFRWRGRLVGKRPPPTPTGKHHRTIRRSPDHRDFAELTMECLDLRVVEIALKRTEAGHPVEHVADDGLRVTDRRQRRGQRPLGVVGDDVAHQHAHGRRVDERVEPPTADARTRHPRHHRST